MLFFFKEKGLQTVFNDGEQNPLAVEKLTSIVITCSVLARLSLMPVVLISGVAGWL